MSTIASILAQLETRFPLSRAESWDKVGLLIGDRSAEIQRVFVAYEVTPAVITAAKKADCELILVYHPLIFRPLEKLDFSDPTAHLCGQILANRQHLLCLHTALDGADPPHALGDALARKLGLNEAKVFKASGVQKLVKIVVFVPENWAQRACETMWQAGAGKIENYDEASFQTRGIGTFRPLEGANPKTGEIGKRHADTETRLEVLAPLESWKKVMEAVKNLGFYEEVAHDIFPLLNADSNQSYGPLRLQKVENSSLETWIERAKIALNVPSVRVVRPDDFELKNVACSPGSGASFIDALPRGTCFITGDIKHHDALKARAQGVAIIDVTHAATETMTVDLMAAPLAQMDVEVVKSDALNPFDFA